MFKSYFALFTLAMLPLLGEEENINATASYEYAFFKMLATLAVLILLFVLSIWLFRRLSQARFGRLSSSKSIKIIERRSLSPKSILYLIEVSGKQILIAESQLEICKIDEVTPRSTLLESEIHQ